MPYLAIVSVSVVLLFWTIPFLAYLKSRRRVTSCESTTLPSHSLPTKEEIAAACAKLTSRFSCHDASCAGFGKHKCHNLNCKEHKG